MLSEVLIQISTIFCVADQEVWPSRLQFLKAQRRLLLWCHRGQVPVVWSLQIQLRQQLWISKEIVYPWPSLHTSSLLWPKIKEYNGYVLMFRPGVNITSSNLNSLGVLAIPFLVLLLAWCFLQCSALHPKPCIFLDIRYFQVDILFHHEVHRCQSCFGSLRQIHKYYFIRNVRMDKENIFS